MGEDRYPLFAVLPRGVEDLARDELAALGAQEARATSGGVAFAGDLAVAYRACLWSRLASRILLPLASFPADSSTALYAGVHAIPWEQHLAARGTLAVDCHARGVPGLNTHFVELKTKDAVVDRIRERCGWRPAVDLQRPSLRLHVMIAAGVAQVSLDLAGEPLHRRGYRRDGGPAPLKENVAAALLLRAGWPAIAAGGGPLVDPMCGAGTLLVEAAWMAADVAPGLGREHFGFLGWTGHRPELWAQLRADAAQRRAAGLGRRLPAIRGSDVDPAAVARAAGSLEAAGLGAWVCIERREVGDCRPPGGAGSGLLATNAPYGQRLGDRQDLAALYRRLGETVKEHFVGWSLALLTADSRLAGEVKMRAHRRNALWNGALRCELLQYRIGEAPGREGRATARR